MVFIDKHFTLALLCILTHDYNIWPGFTTQAPCMQLVVGSLIQELRTSKHELLDISTYGLSVYHLSQSIQNF